MRPEKVIKIIGMSGGIAASQAEAMGRMRTAFLPEALFPKREQLQKTAKEAVWSPLYGV
ncbi:hypothetical protein [Paenibacillus sp. GM2]|uniref:hypothetical protein n=1 Tax=Paenibacillus sp. GM2 TaxID=1622070 RepID=UPI000A44DE4F|nr:hypothetical protein [Paenibacillus sp. GM2]